MTFVLVGLGPQYLTVVCTQQLT